MNAGWLVCLALLAAMPSQTQAGTFSVNPIRLEMAPTQSATSLTVDNFGAQPLLLQVRVYRWEHKDRDDVLTAVDGGEAPIVTPPLFELAPAGGSQVVRIGFQKPATPAAEERQWRVIVEEVPRFTESAPRSTDSAAPAAEPMAVALRVRVSLPLLQRPRAVHQELQWSLQSMPQGRMNLTAQNLGSITERLDEIHLGWVNDADWRWSGPLYLFPGERRSFEVRSDASLRSATVHLSLRGTPRPLTRELVLSAQ